MPKMTHPQSPLTVDAAPDMVAMYASQGWVEKAAPKKRTAKKAAAKKTSARPRTTNPAPAAESKE